MKTVLLATLTTLAAACSTYAEQFVHNFDMNGDYSEFLYETTNARLYDERPAGLLVRYWGPSNANEVGSVTYHYQFDSPISTSSVFANIIPFNSSSEVWLDVSADGVNFTNLFNGVGGPGLQPPMIGSPPPGYDLTSILSGSKSAYIRARLLTNSAGGTISFSQFLRTADSNGTFVSQFLAPNVYQFTATTIPEPSSAALIVGSMVCGGIACRSRKSLHINAAIITLSLAHCVNAAVVPNTTFVNPANGNTYFVLDQATWLEAQAEAVSLGGNLATINDAAENQWIVDTFATLTQIPWSNPNEQTLWIGLNDIEQEGLFKWASGEAVSYENWGPSEPNNLLGVEDHGQIWTIAGCAFAGCWSAGDWNDGGTNLNPGMLELVAGPGLVEIVVPEPSTLTLIGAALLLSRRIRR